MSHEVARHVRYNSKLKALQRTPHHMIINRVRTLLERLHSDGPEAAGISAKPADDQVCDSHTRVSSLHCANVADMPSACHHIPMTMHCQRALTAYTEHL